MHLRTTTTTPASPANQSSASSNSGVRRTASPVRSPGARRGGVAESNLNETSENDLQPLGGGGRLPAKVNSGNERSTFESGKDASTRNAVVYKSSLEVNNTRRKPHIGTISEQQNQISVSKSADNLRDVNLPSGPSSSHNR